MKKIVQTLLLLWAVLAAYSAAGQAPGKGETKYCGTPEITKEYLVAHPEAAKRMATIEEHTRRYIQEANAVVQKGTGMGGPLPALLTIPVVVHIVYNNAALQNVSDAVVQSQIEELNLGFRKLSPNVVQVPAPFAPLVADARVNFCLATRDPNGNLTTGITRRSTSVTAFSYYANDVKSAATGGTNAWNTASYLNIWACNIPGFAGYAVFPGDVPLGSGLDGIVMNYNAFGRGHVGLDGRYILGRVAIHEVGHWLNLRHIWGDAACGNDLVGDTPIHAGPNRGTPFFPRMSGCVGGDPNGDMFMNHMDYVDDGSKLMFTNGQVQRMQAVIAPGGFRAALRSSPAFNPILSIVSTAPATVLCGDRTDYGFRAAFVSLGCAGGQVRYDWCASNGWAVDFADQVNPDIIPNGTSGSTITLTGTYINAQGVAIALPPVSVTVGFDPQSLPAPVFTGGPTMLCSNQAGTFTVGAVAGATGYRWTVPFGLNVLGQTVASNGQVVTPDPILTVVPTVIASGGTYSVFCQTLPAGNCALSSSGSFDVNGGPPFRIVDATPAQNFQGLVCQQNRIRLKLVPTSSGASTTAAGVVWSSGQYATVASPSDPLEATFFTIPVGGPTFTVTAEYTNNCGSRVFAIPYTATTATSNVTLLGNGYSCIPNRYRSVAVVPYPNPATASLQLPGYQGQVTVYNQQGKPVQSLVAPGTDYGATVDTSTWPEGLYVVTGRGLTGEFLRHNVQIQH